VPERKPAKTVISIPIYTLADHPPEAGISLPANASANRRDRERNLTTLGIIEVTDFSPDKSGFEMTFWVFCNSLLIGIFFVIFYPKNGLQMRN
jgi:hypothetical protein